MKRCGSPATIAAPLAVRSPDTTQPLEPAVPGPSVANSSVHSSPSRRATSSRHSLVGIPAKRMWVASQTARGVHGSQRPGVSPVGANSGARSAPSDRPALTPSTYARTHRAVAASSRSKQRRAVSASRARRTKVSQPASPVPRNEAVVP